MDENESLDTLFAGLITEPVQRRSPFKFLDAYGPADRALFFGRDNEIRDLYARFYRGRILLVYGESGTGKTSLIECGLRSEIPAEEAVFVTVRTAQDPFEAVRWALQRVLKTSEALAIDRLVRLVVEQKHKSLVLVFDQFEELFLFQPASVRQAFAQAVQGWLAQERNLHVVLGLREEYLARATELEPYWPELFRNRLWIRHLARTDAEAAILGPCKICEVALEEGLVSHILVDLSGDGSEVELPIFQVVLDSLYRLALAETPEHPRLTLGAYRKLGQVQTILGRFLEERIQRYAEAGGAARQILKALITVEGTRQSGTRQDLVSRARQFGPDLADGQVTELLQRLIADRLVREDPDRHWYELRHDALAQQIHRWMSDLEQELVDLRQTLENRLREYQRHRRLLGADVLVTLAPYENRLALSGELAELVRLSKNWVRRRDKLRFWGGATIFVIVLAFGIFSFVQWQEVKRQKAEVQFNLATNQHNLGAFYAGRPVQTDVTKASELYQDAINRLTDLVQEYPNNPEYPHRLATDYRDLGNLLGANGDIGGAKEAFLSASKILARLVGKFAERADYRNGWADVEGNLAWFELLAQHPKEAIAAAYRGLQAGPSDSDRGWIEIHLAHGYLFDNQYEKALELYIKNKSRADDVKNDFKRLREKGLSHPDMEKVQQRLDGSD